MTLAARLLPRLALGGFLAAAMVACSPSLTSTPSPASGATAPTETLGPTLTPATPTPIVTPTPVPTPVGGVGICATADLKASHGLAEGAAGSIITQVVLESNSHCTVETSPSLGLQDKSGSALVAQTPAGPGTIELHAGVAYTSQVRIANWCAPEPAFPLALILWIDGEKLIVTGGSFPDGGMPGCLGSGGVQLESTAWVASP
ncbi:MAG TPA: hypothetical protein VE011_05710 [Candidatus Dormibacteraeota bacterium]|nr:hypothetical protein [Candidatus Dormibacteraeota bacterium]